MDVIALAQAGIDHAVAPLGTAITEAQLAALWKLAPEPVVALDGDAAGLAAAQRLIDLALPLLGAGRSLRFALMPPGQDPDDVVRAGGAAAMQALLDASRPIVDLLWTPRDRGPGPRQPRAPRRARRPPARASRPHRRPRAPRPLGARDPRPPRRALRAARRAPRRAAPGPRPRRPRRGPPAGADAGAATRLAARPRRRTARASRPASARARSSPAASTTPRSRGASRTGSSALALPLPRPRRNPRRPLVRARAAPQMSRRRSRPRVAARLGRDPLPELAASGRCAPTATSAPAADAGHGRAARSRRS